MKKCCAKKRCDIVEFTLFWRKFQYVANYAFFVLSFGSKIFVCAILYAFSIFASDKSDMFSRDLNLNTDIFLGSEC